MPIVTLKKRNSQKSKSTKYKIEHMPQVVFIVNKSGNITAINKELSRNLKSNLRVFDDYSQAIVEAKKYKK